MRPEPHGNIARGAAIDNVSFIAGIWTQAPQGAARFARMSGAKSLRKNHPPHPLRFSEQALAMREDESNYLSIASFRCHDGEEPLAIPSRFAALHAVVVHDTRRPDDNQWLQPATWVTRLGLDSYEYGYVLQQPVLDLVLAKRLLLAAQAAYPGQVRSFGDYLRLPLGNAYGFVPYLVKWSPTVRADVNLLYGVLIMTSEREQRKAEREQVEVQHDSVYEYRPTRITMEGIRRAVAKNLAGNPDHAG